jgi:cytoskeletal protein RodZ
MTCQPATGKEERKERKERKKRKKRKKREGLFGRERSAVPLLLPSFVTLLCWK